MDVVGSLSANTGLTDRRSDGGSDRSDGIWRHQEARSGRDNGHRGQFEVRRAYRARRGGPGHQ